MAQLTVEQDGILAQVNAAIASDNIDNAVELAKLLPMPPELAKAAKEVLGSDFLLHAGFNLSAAEQEYGQDWLLR